MSSNRKPYKRSKEQREFERKRMEMGLKYAKSTFIRYMTAAFMVMTIYWLFVAAMTTRKLLFIPVVYAIVYIVAMADQYLTLHNHKKGLYTWTDKIMKVTMLTDLVFLIISIIDYKLVFPFFSRMSVSLVIFVASLFIKFIIINKIKKIQTQ